ncbi:MAG: hypothetical protein ABW106_05755 [Steroidobacteraceae bacterium]
MNRQKVNAIVDMREKYVYIFVANAVAGCVANGIAKDVVSVSRVIPKDGNVGAPVFLDQAPPAAVQDFTRLACGEVVAYRSCFIGRIGAKECSKDYSTIVIQG